MNETTGAQSQPINPEALRQALLRRTGLSIMPEDFRLEARKLVENLTLHNSKVSGKAFGFSSSRPGEGVSTIAASTVLAFGLATAGKTLFIDANFSDPLAFSRDGGMGFTDLLAGRCDASQAIQELEGMPVSLLRAGNAGEEIATQVSDDRVARVIQDLRSQFGVLVVDLAPPLLCPFSNRVARVLDGLVLVVEAHTTDRLEIDLTVASVRRAQVPILGFVFNRRRYRA